MKSWKVHVADFIFTIGGSFFLYAAGYYCFCVSVRLFNDSVSVFPSVTIVVPALPAIFAAVSLTAILVALFLAVRMGGSFLCGLGVLLVHGAVWFFFLPLCCAGGLRAAALPAQVGREVGSASVAEGDLNRILNRGTRAAIATRENTVGLEGGTVFGDLLSVPPPLDWAGELLLRLWKQGMTAWNGGWVAWLGFSALWLPLVSLVLVTGSSRKKLNCFSLVLVLFVVLVGGNGLFYSTGTVQTAREWTRSLLNVFSRTPAWMTHLETYFLIALANGIAAVLIGYNVLLVRYVRRYRERQLLKEEQ
jgi:hypothetical protein